jgi:2-polyprenyl-6-methoxyphenol hydroxylase-like FAD-dependent oxidoreductase
MARTVLISGASIAGCAAAWWLGRNGFDVTVIEKASEFRDGGQNVDVRGEGRKVLRLMGLEDAALAHGTGEKGIAWVDENDDVVAKIITEKLGTDGPTAEMEILRGDLSRLLYEPARARAAFRFGETIRSVAPTAHGVSVRFKSGAEEEYDILLVAEGVGSSTRELVFSGQNSPRWMDMTMAYFTIPRVTGDDQLWRWFNAPGCRSVSIRPDMHGTMRANLSLHRRHGDKADWDPSQQKAWLRDEFRDAGWRTPRVLDAMETTQDFYLDVLRQVRMPRWSQGRVVLLGDAAWCVTPLGGVGATLAISGAYVLAGELVTNSDVEGAFQKYEAVMRPFVRKAQGIPKIVPRLVHPRTRTGIAVLHGILRVMAAPSLQKVSGGLFAGNAEAKDLPQYSALTR